MTEKRFISNIEFEEARNNRDNKKILSNLAHQYSNVISADELNVCKDMSLWKALQYHNENHPSKQKFTTSLHQFMKWECNSYLSQKNRKKLESLDNYTHQASGSIPFDEIMMRDCIDTLPKNYRDLIYYKFYDNMTLEEIAAKVDYSKESVRQHLQKALDKLKQVFLQGEQDG